MPSVGTEYGAITEIKTSGTAFDPKDQASAGQLRALLGQENAFLRFNSDNDDKNYQLELKVRNGVLTLLFRNAAAQLLTSVRIRAPEFYEAAKQYRQIVQRGVTSDVLEEEQRFGAALLGIEFADNHDIQLHQQRVSAEPKARALFHFCALALG